MRYQREHKVQTRKRIVENASRGMREQGFGGISVHKLMRMSGLTHGGFYNHFKSRDTLFEEGLAFALAETEARWTKRANSASSQDGLNAVVRSYLTFRARDDWAGGCPLAGLGTDVGRSGVRIRHRFAKDLNKLIDLLVAQLGDMDTAVARELATSTIATMVGTLVLARATRDQALSKYVLKTGRGAALGYAADICAKTVRDRKGARKEPHFARDEILSDSALPRRGQKIKE